MDDTEKMLDAKEKRRFAADARAEARLDRQWDEAEKLIGELVRDGKTIHYINITTAKGSLTGRTKEFTSFGSAVDYLIRNRYI